MSAYVLIFIRFFRVLYVCFYYLGFCSCVLLWVLLCALCFMLFYGSLWSEFKKKLGFLTGQSGFLDLSRVKYGEQTGQAFLVLFAGLV